MKRFSRISLIILVLLLVALCGSVSAEDSTTTTTTDTSATTTTTSTTITTYETNYSDYVIFGVLDCTDTMLEWLASWGMSRNYVHYQFERLISGNGIDNTIIAVLDFYDYEIAIVNDFYKIVEKESESSTFTSETTPTTTFTTATTATTTPTTTFTTATTPTTATTAKSFSSTKATATTTTTMATQVVVPVDTIATISSNTSASTSTSTGELISPEVIKVTIKKSDLERIKSEGNYLAYSGKDTSGKEYMWNIDSKDVGSNLKDINAEVSYESRYKDRIAMALGNDTYFFDFAVKHEGEFGIKATLVLKVGNTLPNGTYYLHKFSKVMSTGEYISEVDVEDGYAYVVLSEGGDYFITTKKLEVQKAKSMIWDYIFYPLIAIAVVGVAVLLIRFVLPKLSADGKVRFK